MIGVVQRLVESWCPKSPVIGHATWSAHFRYLFSAGVAFPRTSDTQLLASAVPAHTSADGHERLVGLPESGTEFVNVTMIYLLCNIADAHAMA